MNYDFTASKKPNNNNNQIDPYEVLNLSRDADTEIIKQRFRALTRTHHPDRNRKNPKYDPTYYTSVCQAYEILSDPRKRAAYDQSSAASFGFLRNAALESAGNQVTTKSRFASEGDIKQFNEAFERQKKQDPNDRGYGDMMQSGRITEQEVKGGRRPVDTPNLFGGTTKVGDAVFNQRFQAELQSKRKARAPAIMERGEGEPEGWFQTSGAYFSDISMHDGVIVNAERDDFSRTEGGGQLNYADYMSGFDTIIEHLPEDHPYYQPPADIKKAHGERMAQLSQIPERGHGLSFAQSEALLQQQREKALAHEAEKNRQIVLKYKDQYSSQDLLPPTRKAQPAHPTDRMFFQPSGTRRK